LAVLQPVCFFAGFDGWWIIPAGFLTFIFIGLPLVIIIYKKIISFDNGKVINKIFLPKHYENDTKLKRLSYERPN
jgi:hypothetical protein